jgi:hypothetical protein
MAVPRAFINRSFGAYTLLAAPTARIILSPGHRPGYAKAFPTSHPTNYPSHKTITQALKGRFKFPHSFRADLIKSNKKDPKQ